MNKIVRKLFVNKKENTRKLKYESLLEENKEKNDRIIDLLYERIDLNNKIEFLSDEIKGYQMKLKAYMEKVNTLEEKKAELLHELEEKRTKKRVKKND